MWWLGPMALITAMQTTSPAPTVAPTTAPTGPMSVSTAVTEVLSQAKEPVRVAVLPVKGGDDAVNRQVESVLLRSLIEFGAEPITPATVQNVLGARALNRDGNVDSGPMRELSADHILGADVLGGNAGVVLRLIHVESGAVVAQRTALLENGEPEKLRTMRAGIGRLLDEIVVAIAQRPGELRLMRVAVAPLTSLDASSADIKLDLLVRAQLEEGLLRRGFLVVERERFNEVSSQLALGATLTEESAPEVGKALGVQAFVFGSIADAGDHFVVTARVVDANDGKAMGAATANLRREGAVTLASGSIETRTRGEALFRSAVAPGWGQAYNQQPVKSVIFGALAYGGLISTAALAVGGAVLATSYASYVPPAGAKPDEYTPLLRGLREGANGLFLASLVGLGITATAWSVNVADAYFSAPE